MITDDDRYYDWKRDEMPEPSGGWTEYDERVLQEAWEMDRERDDLSFFQSDYMEDVHFVFKYIGEGFYVVDMPVVGNHRPHRLTTGTLVDCCNSILELCGPIVNPEFPDTKNHA